MLIGLFSTSPLVGQLWPSVTGFSSIYTTFSRGWKEVRRNSSAGHPVWSFCPAPSDLACCSLGRLSNSVVNIIIEKDSFLLLSTNYPIKYKSNRQKHKLIKHEMGEDNSHYKRILCSNHSLLKNLPKAPCSWYKTPSYGIGPLQSGFSAAAPIFQCPVTSVQTAINY